MSNIKPISVPAEVNKAITRAGERNGVDFNYLLTTAMRESSLNPEAKAKTSSATGLFQFIETTWFEVLKEEGSKLGYGDVARHIEHTAKGYDVADPKMRAAILSLRENPEMSADLAAAFTRRNGEYLFKKFGRMPSGGEPYIAHFMGARGAERLFELGLSRPNDIAAEHFPAPARANKPIFYDGERPRTIKQVYQVLVAKHRALGQTQTQIAANSAPFAAQQMAQSTSWPFPASTKPLVTAQAGIPGVADVSSYVPSRYGSQQPQAVASAPEKPSDAELRAAQFFTRFVTDSK